MCFYIDPKHPDKKKAKRDITCYKIINKEWRSYIQIFKYVQGKTCSDGDALDIEKHLFGMKVIHRGYHSYSNKKIALHNCYQMAHKYMLVRCIIPEGSDYYYNSSLHEYVSNKIKITDVIKTITH